MYDDESEGTKAMYSLQVVAWTAFGVLTLQMVFAVVVGRISCREHAVSRWAWPISLVTLVAALLWKVEWAFVIGGAIATLGLMHIGWELFLALRSHSAADRS
jgi:hypothetical protein